MDLPSIWHIMLRLFFALTLQTAVLMQVVAQNLEVSPNNTLSQSSIHQWTGENGLASNNITSSLQAKSGFIWITTYNGIMRFDGTTVDVYDRQNIPFLKTDAFYRVYEGKDGILWFASQGSGIVRLRNNKFELFHPAELPKSIRCIFLDSDGSVWAGSNNEGLFHSRGENSIEPIYMDLFKGKFILDITRYKNSIWVATEGDGLYEISDTGIKQYTEAEGLFSNVVNTLSESPSGSLLIGTSTGLNEFLENHISKYDFLKNTRINFISSDKQNRIWLGTEIGLGRIDSTQNTVEFIGEDDGYPLARINSIDFDNEGSVWVTTGRDGLIQIKQTMLLNLSTRTGLSMDRTNVVVEANDHSFYIGSDGGHINIYRNGKIENLPIKTPLHKAGIRDICFDEDGILWIASYKGIIQKTKTTEKLWTEKDGLPAIDMRRVLRDANNNLWFASRSGGVVKFRDRKILNQYNKNKGLNVNYVLALEEDKNGNIYVGTHSGGLTIIKPDGTTQTHHITPDDSGVLIFNIHISDDGSIWLVCNIGLLKFNGTGFEVLKLDHSTKGETHFDWIEDFNKDVWITSNIGILKIKYNDLQKYLEGEITNIPTKLFDNQDGMKNKECTPTRSIVSASGKIWIPTIGGVAVFYPELVKGNRIIPAVYITPP